MRAARRVRHGACVAGAIAALLGARSASAAPRVAIDVAAFEGCPDRGDFFFELKKRLPSAELTEAPSARYVAKVRFERGDGARVRGVLHLETGGDASDRPLEGATCEEVVDALALVFALAIEEREEATRANPTPPAPDDGSPPSSPPAQEDARAWRAAVVARGTLRGTLAPSASLGGTLGFELRQSAGGGIRLAPSVRIMLGYAANDFSLDQGRRAIMRAGIATLEGCAPRAAPASEWIAVDACAHAELGFVDARVRPDGLGGSAGPWLLAGVGLRGRVAVSRTMFVEADGALDAPLSQNRFWLGNNRGTPYFTQPDVSWGAGLGVGATFP